MKIKIESVAWAVYDEVNETIHYMNQVTAGKRTYTSTGSSEEEALNKNIAQLNKEVSEHFKLNA